MENKTRIASGVGLVAGLWLILSAFLASVGLYSNFFVVGILVVIVSLMGLLASSEATWVGWTNGILGAWLLISPLFFSAMTMRSAWNSALVGIVILGFSLWSTMSSSSTMGHGSPGMN